MAEFTRTLVSRLRQFVGDRRNEKRQQVRLPFSLTLSSPAKSLNGTRRVISMEGHTLDLSPTGLSLITPKITLAEHHLVGENRILNVKLELPESPVEMQVLPVRYESLEDHESESGYLIGAHIVTMSDEHRTVFEEYVASLTGRKQATN